MPQIGGKPKVSKATKATKKKSSSSTKRNFTVVIGSKEHGIYVSSSPSSAARKAVSKLCATDKKRKVQFHIREITQKSEKKTYGPYLGYIEKLAKPIAKLKRKYCKNKYIRGGENSNSTYTLKKIDNYDELLTLYDFVHKLSMNNNSATYKGRKNKNVIEIKKSLLDVIRAKLLRIQSLNHILTEHNEFLCSLEDNYEPYVIKDSKENIISICAISKIIKSFKYEYYDFSIRDISFIMKYYLELYLILVVPKSQKGSGKASITTLLNNLDEKLHGIIVKPLDDAVGFYEKLGFTPHEEKMGYYTFTKE